MKLPLKQNTRRICVVLLWISAFFILLLYRLNYTDFSNETLLLRVFQLISVASAITLYIVLNRSAQRVGGLNDKGLDERQKALHNLSYMKSLVCLRVLFIIPLIYLPLAFSNAGGEAHVLTGYLLKPIPFLSPQADLSTMILAGFILIHILPMTFVAWLEPDLIEEELVNMTPSESSISI